LIVVDASAAISALLRSGAARQRLSTEALHAPHLVDTEVTDAVRKLVLRDTITRTAGGRAVSAWAQLGVKRYPTIGMLQRIWDLRHNLSAYDAAYVALAETLNCHLVTADQRLAAATGPRCTIELVPR
jgi:predicted nucleic acid-binding protein